MPLPSSLPKVFTSKNSYVDTAGNVMEVALYRDLVRKRQRWDVQVIAPEARSCRVIEDYRKQQRYEIDLDANTCRRIRIQPRVSMKPIRLLRGASLKRTERIADSVTRLYHKEERVSSGSDHAGERYVIGPEYRTMARIANLNVVRTGRSLNPVAIREQQRLRNGLLVQSFTLIRDFQAYTRPLDASVFAVPEDCPPGPGAHPAHGEIAPSSAGSPGDLGSAGDAPSPSRLVYPAFVTRRYAFNSTMEVTSQEQRHFDSLSNRERVDIRQRPHFNHTIRLISRYDLQRLYEVDLGTGRCNSFPLTGTLIPPSVTETAVFLGYERVGNSRVEFYHEPNGPYGLEFTWRMFRRGDRLEYVSDLVNSSGIYTAALWTDFTGSEEPLPESLFAPPSGCDGDAKAAGSGNCGDPAR
ncbi:MAG: hypothetical protein ACK47B_04330 [Armatimonadota bacterium]